MLLSACLGLNFQSVPHFSQHQMQIQLQPLQLCRHQKPPDLLIYLTALAEITFRFSIFHLYTLTDIGRCSQSRTTWHISSLELHNATLPLWLNFSHENLISYPKQLLLLIRAFEIFLITYLEEPADDILMSTREDWKSFLVGEKDAGWYNEGLDRFTGPTLDLLFRWQVGGQLKNNSNFPAAITESSEAVPPTPQNHFNDHVQD